MLNDGRRGERIKEGRASPPLIPLSAAAAAAIMVVMKAHLSPSQPNLIILHEIGLWNVLVCVRAFV